MKNLLKNFLFIFLLVACSTPTVETDNNDENKKLNVTTTKCSINLKVKDVDTLIVDSLTTKIDSVVLNPLPIDKVSPTNYKKIKFPTLMVVANGCAGVTTYTYKSPEYGGIDEYKPIIKVFNEYPNCPDIPGYTSPKGTFFSKIPSKFSICKTNYIIKIMQEKVPNYLELYNNYFKDDLKIRTPPPYTVNFPDILYIDEGKGGDMSITFDITNNRIKNFRTIHNHSAFYDPNDCRQGVYLSQLPDTLADSTIQLIIDETSKFYSYKNYKELYIKKYGAFPFKNDSLK